MALVPAVALLDLLGGAFLGLGLELLGLLAAALRVTHFVLLFLGPVSPDPGSASNRAAPGRLP